MSPNADTTRRTWSEVVSRRRLSVTWNQILSCAKVFEFRSGELAVGHAEDSSIERSDACGSKSDVHYGSNMRAELAKISPTNTGRSLMTEMPPKRFSIVFCAASAIAMPPTPRPARIVVVL